MKRQTVFPKLLALVLAIALLPGANVAWAYTDAFDKDHDKTLHSYVNSAGWDMSRLEEPPDPAKPDGAWSALYGGETVRWKDDNQTQLYYSGMSSTAAYVWGMENGTWSSGTLGLPTPNGNNIAAIAKSQIGVRPLPDHYCHVGYVDDFLGYSPSSYEGQNWCCYFVVWCAEKLGYVRRSENDIFAWTGGCTTQFHYMVDTKHYPYITVQEAWAGTAEVVPGDIFFFYNGASYPHIGIVYEVGPNNSYITTIEGNTTGSCDPTDAPKGTAVHYQKYTPRTNYPAMQNGFIVRPPYPGGSV